MSAILRALGLLEPSCVWRGCEPGEGVAMAFAVPQSRLPALAVGITDAFMSVVRSYDPPTSVLRFARWLRARAHLPKGIFHKQRTIAKQIGYSERTVNAAVAWLKDRGLLIVRRDRGRRRSAEYVARVGNASVELVEKCLQEGDELRLELRRYKSKSSELSLSQGYSTESIVPQIQQAPKPVESNADMRVRNLLRKLPKCFELTPYAEDALMDRLRRKVAFWRRSMDDVAQLLEQSVGTGKWRHARKTAYWMACIEAHLHVLALDAAKPNAPLKAPEVSLPMNRGVILEWSSRIAEVANRMRLWR